MTTSWLLGCALMVAACVGCGGATEGQLGGADPSPMPIAMVTPDAGSPEASPAVTVDAGNAPEAAAVAVAADDAAPEAALEAAVAVPEGGGEDAGMASDDGGKDGASPDVGDGGLPPCPVPTASYAWVGVRAMVSMTGGYVPWPGGPNYQFPNGVQIDPWYYQDTTGLEFVSSPPPESLLMLAPEAPSNVFQFEGLPGAPIWIRTRGTILFGSKVCADSPWLRFEIPADAGAGSH